MTAIARQQYTVSPESSVTMVIFVKGHLERVYFSQTRHSERSLPEPAEQLSDPLHERTDEEFVLCPSTS